MMTCGAWLSLSRGDCEVTINKTTITLLWAGDPHLDGFFIATEDRSVNLWLTWPEVRERLAFWRRWTLRR